MSLGFEHLQTHICTDLSICTIGEHPWQHVPNTSMMMTMLINMMVLHTTQYFTPVLLASGAGQCCWLVVLIVLASGAAQWCCPVVLSSSRWPTWQVYCAACTPMHEHVRIYFEFIIPITIIPISIIIIILIIISIIIIIVIVAIIIITNIISNVIMDVFVTCCQGSWPMLPASGADQW
jgi:hypothetical protein